MRNTITAYYCDRCGEKMSEDFSFYCDTHPNAAIKLLQDGEWKYADLCDKCKESFKVWWKENTESEDKE